MRFAGVIVLLVAGVSLAQTPHFPDASLRCVQFVDENEGWAGGDDGVIWHTIDAGKTWERQPTGIRASIRSIQFLTPYSGWAAGRIELPQGGTSGVVLATSDGGLKWRVVSANSVPGLNAIKFFGERDGIAAGDGSESFPSGLFTTQDGGQTWKQVPGPRCPTWFAADFSDAETGVLAGAWNRLAPVREGQLGVADVDSLGGRSVTGIKLNGERAVAVGQGGLVMISRDTAGVRWGFPDLKLSKEVRAAIDFHAVHTVKNHIWAVGKPGSVVFHSADFGNTWEAIPTGQSLPLNAIHFADENRGWAAGEMGTILATTDGGKTWTVQRQGGMRAAMMFVQPHAKNTPLDTVAALGGEEGYLTVSLGVASSDPATLARRYDSDAERLAAGLAAADPRRATDSARSAQAMRLSGGAGAEVLWHFPIAGFQNGPDSAALLASWEKRHGEAPAVAMLRQIVLSVRTWRPDAIAVEMGDDELSKLIVAVVRKAFEVAADENMFPEQIQSLRLAPWAGRKLFASMSKADPTSVRMDVVSASPRLGTTPADVATNAARVWDEPTFAPAYRLIATRLADTAGHVKFFDGISLAPGGAARRELPQMTEKELTAADELKKLHEKRRHQQAVVDGLAGQMVRPEQALATIADAVRDLPTLDAGKAMYTAAESYARAGQWHLAREAFQMLIDKHPGHPLTLDAARWIVRYQSSSEARRRHEMGQFIVASETSFELKERKLPKRDKDDPKLETVHPPATDVVQAGFKTVPPAYLAAAKWYQQALQYEDSLIAHGNMFIRDVPMQLCLASARRQIGQAEKSGKWLMHYLAETTAPGATYTRGSDPWRDCVLLESWLLTRGGGAQPPKPVAACRHAVRPNLDGLLDDACWKNAIAMPLSSVAGELGPEFGGRESIEHKLKKGDSPEANEAINSTSRAMFAFDDEYLYMAVVCKHPAGMKKEKVESRRHDMNLQANDRVSIMIDLDRDYQTYYRLEVDQRGAVSDDCWGDKSWSPKWFVSSKQDETGWVVEAAIPLSELTGEVVAPGKMWAVNVVRTIPGKGLQAWSTPAGATPRPEGMGLMTFVGK